MMISSQTEITSCLSVALSGVSTCTEHIHCVNHIGNEYVSIDSTPSISGM